MLRAYVSACPTSIDGVWSSYLTTLPPPLTFAAELGRPQVVSLLLDHGADPYRSDGTAIFGSSFCSHGCNLLGFNHKCPRQDAPGYAIDTASTTAMSAVLHAGFRLRPGSTEHQATEECAMVLYSRGVALPFDFVVLSTRYFALRQQVQKPIKAGFLRLIRAFIDPVASREQGGTAFRIALYYMLQTACEFQYSDDHRGVIDYLLEIGAPLAYPDSVETIYFLRTNAYRMIARFDHPMTGVFFINLYIEQHMSFDFENMALYGSTHYLEYTQALYRLMSTGNQFFAGERVSAKRLHDFLLLEAINNFEYPAIAWLTEQGVGSRMHLPNAISLGHLSLVEALMQTGACSVHDLMEDQWTPLELALQFEEWKVAALLISLGGDPSLVSEETKQLMLGDFQRIFPMTYEESQQTITPDMLQPEYFGTYDKHRKRAIFHYVIDGQRTDTLSQMMSNVTI
ncbi:hypothetical protein GGS24DRAFT_447653 [Hypoxylon argillaceum]|nr:hypothetical protein GGS24DRAFT_447653 [Hypoxylon argillaceum]